MTCTPVTRCSASTTLLSGSLPMSSATIDSTTCVDCFLFSRPLRRASRTPVTTMVSASSGVPCCATAPTEMESAANADAEVIRLLTATLYPP